MKPAIKIKAEKHVEDTEQARHDFATVTGHDIVLKPAVFCHIETNQHYCNIIGGIAYPTANDPGIVIIMGIQNEPIKFRILDVYEDDNVFKLIANCIEMRTKWGFGLDSRILPWWYGDQEKFQTLIIKASADLEKKLGYDRGMYVKDMVDLREKHAFPLYIRQLFAARESGILEQPSKSGFMNIVGYIQGFNRELAEKTKTEDYPAVGLLAGMIHSLQIELSRV
jgi:hypothetical protein